jgi:hypothetical protein
MIQTAKRRFVTHCTPVCNQSSRLAITAADGVLNVYRHNAVSEQERHISAISPVLDYRVCREIFSAGG